MKILFDQGTPVPLRRFLHPHIVDTASECGWDQLKNGDLIEQAEQKGYQIFITTDQNLRYQQNLKNRIIKIFVLKSTSWPRIKNKIQEIQNNINDFTNPNYIEIEI